MPQDDQSKNNRSTLRRCIQPLWLTCGPAMRDTRPGATPSRWHLELTHQFEHLVALLDFFHRDFPQLLQAECFHATTVMDTAVEHCLAHIVEIHGLDGVG